MRPKIITALGMFYDLEDPNKFIGDIRRVLHPDGVFVAQLMCLKQTVEQGDVGNFAHEHLEFYSLQSLAQLLRQNGLRIFRVEENKVNGGSYRIYACHWNSTRPSEASFFRAAKDEHDMGLDKAETYRKLFSRMEENKRLCVDAVTKAVRQGKKVWVYGASTKGNVILQYYGLTSISIEGAADKSAEKHGLYTVGTGIRISNEDRMRRSCPAYLLILPYAFVEEFVTREQSLREQGTKFLVPLPNFEVR